MEPYKIRYIYTPIGTRMFPLVSDARLYTYLSLLILAHCTHTHTRVHSIFTSQERCISWKEVSWNCIDWNPCKPLRPSDVYRVIGSLEMRFLAIVRQIRRRLPPWWTGSIMEISRPAEGGMGRILRSMEISLLFPPLRFLEIINTIYSWTNSFFFC